MKTRHTEGFTAIYTAFSTIKQKLRPVNTIPCFCLSHVGILAASNRMFPLHPLKSYITVVLLLSGLFAFTENAQAQNYNEYDEQEFDGSYAEQQDYGDPYHYYNLHSAQQRQDNRRYRGDAKEDELYNGGYRKYVKNDDTWKSGSWSTTPGTEWKKPRNEGNPTPRLISEPVPGKKWFDSGNDGTNKNRNPEMVNADGTVSGTKDEPGKGSARGDDNNDFGPPPPPDEPDVPIDSAIPLLIAGGIIIASLRFYTKKSGSY